MGKSNETIPTKASARALLRHAMEDVYTDTFSASEKAQEALDVLREICNHEMIMRARNENHS